MFPNIKQSQKEIGLILVAFILLIVLSIGVKLYDAYHVREMYKTISKITEHPLKVSSAALNAQVEISRFRNVMVQIVFFPDKKELPNRIRSVHAYEKMAEANLDIVNKQILGEKGQKLARDTEKLFKVRTAVREDVIEDVIEGDMDEAVRIFMDNEASYTSLINSVSSLYTYARGRADLYQKESDELFVNFERMNFYASMTLLLLFGLIAYYTLHRISSYVTSNEDLSKSLKEKSDELVLALNEEVKEEEILREQAEIFDSIQDSIILHDLEGNFLYLNENAWKTRGYTHDEMMKMTLKEIVAPEYHRGDPQMLKDASAEMNERGHVKIRVEHICKNGDRLPVEVYAKSMTYHSQPCILKSIRDISQQLKEEEEIKKLSTVLEQIDDAVMITDKKGIMTYVNEAFCNHTGYKKEELLGNTPRIFKSNQQTSQDYKNLWKTILDGKVYQETLVNKKKNGDLYFEIKTITPLRDNNEAIIGFVSTGKDVTQEMLAHQEMERKATIDKLTGIYNHHKFEEQLPLEMQRSQRYSQPLSLILIDIDHFKSVNDVHGHDVGDEVLKHLVKIVQENIRKFDVFARWGGEGFLVLSPSTDLESVKMLAEKLRLAVEHANFPKVSHITISQGIGMFVGEETFDDVFKRVDQGLYYAKEHGRNQVGVITS
jgi:diguanylate cyclase (GGDEF)-like protein/PAS domain S-box-containing protein